MLGAGSRRFAVLGDGDRAHLETLAPVRRARSATALVLVRELLRTYVPDHRQAEVRRDRGRPEVAAAGVDLSVSHSGDLVVAVVGAGLRVGVDVQRVEPRWDVAGLSGRVLHERETRLVGGAPDDAAARFAEMWARKEAYVKLTGTGIDEAVTRLDTSRLGPSRSARDASGPTEVATAPQGSPTVTSTWVGGYALAVALAPGVQG